MNLQEIYKNVILDAAKKCQQTSTNISEKDSFSGFNPTCGDQVILQPIWDSNNKLIQLNFHVDGCILCQAAMILMTTTIQGKHLIEINSLITAMLNAMTNQQEMSSILGNNQALIDIVKLPMRVKCVLLPWLTLQSCLKTELL